MYIKIKHIKQFLLISACVFLAGFNYLNFVKADDTATITSVDSDSDGLTDAEEKLYKTDINNPDTDGDGYSDGVEVKSGYDPTIAAPADRITETTSVTADPLVSTETSLIPPTGDTLTDVFSNELTTLIESKGDQPITSADIDTFVSEKLNSEVGEPVTMDTLPEVDLSTMKILDQTYASLTADERKQKIKEDAERYYLRVAYILLSSSPKPLLAKEDFSTLVSDFLSNINAFSSSTTNYAYFLDLGKRLDLLLTQLLEVETPQTLVNIQVKIIRIAKGYLELRDTFVATNNDPMMKMVLVSKVQGLNALVADFFQNDFSDYNQQYGL